MARFREDDDFSTTDNDDLDVLTFRFSHDPAILKFLTDLQLARAVVRESLKPAFSRAVESLGGQPMTIEQYCMLVRNAAMDEVRIQIMAAHLFDQNSDFAHLVRDIVQSIGQLGSELYDGV